MEMLSFGFLSAMMLFSGSAGLPLGMPPLPEDPVLARVAPEECLAYFSWSGVATPDAKSKNQSEQLLAEPEVRQFVETVGKALGAAIKKGAPQTPQGQVLGKHGPKLIHALLTHPTAIFISKVEIGPAGPKVFGGAIVATGDQTDEIKAAMEQIEKVLTPENAAATQHWHRFPTPPDALHIDWVFEGKYLIFGVGPGSGDGIVARLNGKPPAWFTALKEKLPVERVSTRFYLNVKKALDATAPLLGGPEMRQFFEVLGVANVRTIASVSGLDGSSCLSKTWIETSGDPSGLLSVFGPEPLKPVDLAPIPKDVSCAFAARVHVSKLYDAVLSGMKKFTPDVASSDGAQLEQLESVFGFRIKQDLLDTLGDTWCVYNSPGEGGLLFTGLTLVVPVKDRDRLAKSVARLVELSAGGGNATAPTIKETQFRGQRIFYLNPGSGEFVPFALAWCASDTHLILSLSPQNIRAFLSRDRAAPTLADVPLVAERLKPGDAVLLSYQDTAGSLKITYPILQLFLTFGFTEMQREGIDLDASVLPSLASILRHVEPGVSTLARDKTGLLYTSRQSLPVNISLPTVLGSIMLFGFSPGFLPAF